MDRLAHNLNCIRHRWPKRGARVARAPLREDVEILQSADEKTLRVAGRLLGSRYNRWEEAWQQAALVPNDAESAWVFGAGQGDLPRALLQRKQLQKLFVVVMEPSLWLAGLEAFDQSDWLEDPRVEILTVDEVDDVQWPFAAVVPELLLVEDPRATRLRDRILVELNTPFQGIKHDPSHQGTQQRIEENRSLVEHDGDVQSLFNGAPQCDAFVVGAGPTLEQAIQWLPQQQHGRLVVAVDAALPVLLPAEIVPDVVVSMDAHREGILSQFPAAEIHRLEQTPLVYFPRVHGDVLRAYPGPRLTAYSADPAFEPLARQLPKGTLYASGSVIHPAVDLAVRMGARNLILVGADFSFPRDRFRAGDARPFDLAGLPHWVYDGHGQKVATQPNLRGYLRDLERYIADHPEVHFFNHSADGAAIAGTQLWSHAEPAV